MIDNKIPDYGPGDRVSINTGSEHGTVTRAERWSVHLQRLWIQWDNGTSSEGMCSLDVNPPTEREVEAWITFKST